MLVAPSEAPESQDTAMEPRGEASGRYGASENKKGAQTGAPEGLVAGAGFEPATFGL